jgi:hypothetical protein
MKSKTSKKRIPPTTQKNLKLVHQLDHQLKKLGIDTTKELNHISIDFADIYIACEEYIGIINKIIAKKEIDRKLLVSNITTIEVILYHHIYWHMKKLKNPINKLIQILYSKKSKDVISEIFKFR